MNRVNQQGSRFLSEPSTSKVGQVSENGDHLSLLDMVLICSELVGDHKKLCNMHNCNGDKLAIIKQYAQRQQRIVV